MSSNLNTLTAQPILPILSKRTHSASSPTLNYQKNTLEQSLECKRLIRAKLLNGRPRANTSPGTLNLIRKIRPKTQSFHSLSTQKQFRHHPANVVNLNWCFNFWKILATYTKPGRLRPWRICSRIPLEQPWLQQTGRKQADCSENLAR
jgi:hypothetical protein